MLHRKEAGARRGVVVLVAVCLIGLLAMLALAIDIGVIAIARNQCQNAADAGAMAGARTLNGNSADNYNYDSVPTTAIAAACENRVLGQALQADANTNWNPSDPTQKNQVHPNDYTYTSNQVSVQIGAYVYAYDDANPSNEGFKLQLPRADASDPYGAVRVNINYQGGFYFARILGVNTFNASAMATAVHRPRDVAIIMDLSGSMRFQSLAGGPYNGSRQYSMNPESVFPKFGHYSNVSAAALQGTQSRASSSGEYYDPCNISTTSNSGPPIAEYFFQNALGVTPGPSNRAFTRAPDSQASTPGGDDYPKTQMDKGGSYAVTASDVVGSTSDINKFESLGYQAFRSSFNGYTEGPGYWGKTFFIWPPDPRGSTKDASNSSNYADNGAKDWRQRFFLKYNTSSRNLDWLDHNTILYNSSGDLRTAMYSSVGVTENGSTVNYNYRINYAAIFKWLFAENPKPFPSVLRAGRIKYYDAYPDWTDAELNNRLWTTASGNLSNLNERFWKGYVDFVLCQSETGAGRYSTSSSLDAQIGNGPMFSWNTTQIKQKPQAYMTAATNSSYASGTSAGTDIKLKNVSQSPSVGDYINVGSSSTIYKITRVSSYSKSNSTVTVRLDTATSNYFSNGTSVAVYNEIPGFMSYDDNPNRPRHQFWFGPMTLIDYIGNYNQSRFWMPGNSPEAPAWACKVGIQTAIDDIQNNHPNDFVGLTFFSSPRNSRTDSSGQHNKAVVPLGRSYQQLKDSLWFPPSTVTGTATEITPWDDDFRDVPRANGGTAPGMSFMIAYNMFSSSTANLRFYSQPTSTYRGAAGGLGRKGAARLIIFETDGSPNVRAYANLVSAGSNSYYPIRVANPANLSSSQNSEWPQSGTYRDSEVWDVAQQICNLETANPPGYSTSRKPVQIYCIGYGTLFDPSSSSNSDQTSALNFLQTLQYIGNTANTTSGSDFPMNQRIYGTSDERISRMQAAFTNIMQGGVQVSLIE